MKKKKIGIIAAVVLLLVGAAAGVLILNRDKEKPSQTQEDPVVVPPVVYEVDQAEVVAVPAGETVTVRVHRPTEEAEEEQGMDPPQETDGTAETVLISYHYEDLPQLLDRIRNYCTLLTAEDFGFVPVDEKIMRSKLPTFEEESGSARLVRPLPVGDGEGEADEALFSLLLTWQEKELIVDVGRIPGGIVTPPPPEPMTVSQMLDYFYGRHPSQLGLEGESMTDYRVCALDGMDMVGQTPCMHLNVYSIDPSTGTTVIEGQYLMSSSGTQLYHICADGSLEELGR